MFARAGSISDAAGNILYSDPTNPQAFTIISSNGQYSGIITYPSRAPSTLILPLVVKYHNNLSAPTTPMWLFMLC